MSDHRVKELTDATFRAEVIDSDKPVLVDFWAPWCGPCRAIAPHLEAIAESMGEAVKVTKLNIDEHEQPAVDFNVSAIPTVLLFKDGEAVQTFVGVQPREVYERALNALTN